MNPRYQSLPGSARVRSLGFLVPLVLAGAACGDETPRQVPAAQLVNGLVPASARQHQALPPADRARDVDQRVLSIGVADGDDRYIFSRIVDVAATAGGDTLYVLDQARARVSAFSRDGRYLFHVGRHGQGPGEFQMATNVVLVPGGQQLAVWDAGLKRLTLFGLDGKVVDTTNPAESGGRIAKKLRAWNGGLLMEAHSDPLRTPADQQRGYLVRLDAGGALGEPVLEFTIPPVRTVHREDEAGGTSTTWLNPPAFSPEPAWDVTPSGEVAFAQGAAYELLRVDGSGQPVLRVTRAVRPDPVTRDDRLHRIAEEKQLGWLGNTSLSLDALEEINRARFATVRPLVTGVLADEFGRLWARRFDTADDWRGYASTWDVYGPDGDELGARRFPAGYQPLLIRRGVVYGVRRDDDGVEYLEVYRNPGE